MISTGQVEDYDHAVDLRPRTKGGKQRLYLRDGYVLPLLHTGPHMYLQCRHPTAAELADDTLRTVELTSQMGWDPSDVENKNEISEEEENLSEVQMAMRRRKGMSQIWRDFAVVSDLSLWM
ncbi:MAG: hypothetical protein ACREOZ_03935 [Gloeomargaritales cyanobacterium]